MLALRSLTITAAICLAGAFLPSCADAQAATVDWKIAKDIGPADRRAILQIARKLGVTDPQSVTVPRQSACQLLWVTARPVVGGNRVSTTIVGVRQLKGPGCGAFLPSSRRYVRQGNWIAFLDPKFNPTAIEEWRIRDGEWYRDLSLGEDVPYEDADQIVRAMHQKRFIDRRSAGLAADPPTDWIDPATIFAIRRASSPAQYELMTRSNGADQGYVIRVTIRNGVVELLSIGSWIS